MFQSSVQQACVLVVLLSGVPLAVSAGLGLVVAVLQAATQIQEQCVVFVVKLVGFVAVAYLGSRWGAEQLCEYFFGNLGLFVRLGKG